MSQRMIITIVAMLMLLLSACSSDSPPSDPPPAENALPDGRSAQEAAEQLVASVDTPVHGIVEVIGLITGQDKTKIVTEIWYDGAERIRSVDVESTVDTPGTIYVQNGRQNWFYDPEDNSYSEFTTDPAEGDLFDIGEIVQDMLDTMDVSYLGSEEIANRPTNKLLFTPKEGQTPPTFEVAEISKATIWADNETSFPLKIDIDIEPFGRFTIQHREIEFNPELTDDLFTFVPPEGAQRTDVEVPDVEEKVLTLEEAREQAPFSLLEPTTVPEGFAFEDAILLNITFPSAEKGTQSNMRLIYLKGSEELIISQSILTEQSTPLSESLSEGAKEVTVRGQTGYFTEDETGVNDLIWQENELELNISGPLDEAQLLEIAESLQ